MSDTDREEKVCAMVEDSLSLVEREYGLWGMDYVGHIVSNRLRHIVAKSQGEREEHLCIQGEETRPG